MATAVGNSRRETWLDAEVRKVFVDQPASVETPNAPGSILPQGDPMESAVGNFMYTLQTNPTTEALDRFRKQHPSYHLHHFSRYWEKNVLTCAIEQRAMPLIKHILDEAPNLVHYAAQEDGSAPLTVALSAVRLNPPRQDPEFSYALVRELVGRKTQINACSRKGVTALQAALQGENDSWDKSIWFLLRNKAVIYNRGWMPAASDLAPHSQEEPNQVREELTLIIRRVISSAEKNHVFMHWLFSKTHLSLPQGPRDRIWEFVDEPLNPIQTMAL